MCGIVGYVGERTRCRSCWTGCIASNTAATTRPASRCTRSGGLKVHKAAGKIARLEAALPRRLQGTVGIAHTRWATHGEPSDATRIRTPTAPVRSRSSTTASSRTPRRCAHGWRPTGHVFRSRDRQRGARAPDRGGGGGDLDAGGARGARVGRRDLRPRRARRAAARPHRRGAQRQPGGDRARRARDVRRLRRRGAGAPHAAGRLPRRPRGRDDRRRPASAPRRSTTGPRSKSPATVPWGHEAYDRGGIRALHAQGDPRAAGGVRAHAEGPARPAVRHRAPRRPQADARAICSTIRRVKILGCGSAYYAGHRRRAPDRGADARSRRRRAGLRVPLSQPGDRAGPLYIAVSQSGETADTLAAVHEVRRKGGRVLGIVNVVGSTIARECDGGIYMHAGPEVSVCSTKTFTCTLVAFALLALHLGRIRDLSPARRQRLIAALAAAARADREHPRGERRRAGASAREYAERSQRLLHRPRGRLPGRARGRAEAQGDHLHPRRGVSGVGAQARAAGADLAGDADGA